MIETERERGRTDDAGLPPRRTMVGSDVPEQDAADRSGEAVTIDELSPAEAVKVFNISEATLRRLLAAGSLPAKKINGVRGREWRISASALEDAGYTRRPSPGDSELVPYSEVRRLQANIEAERARASQLDGQLGHALLTIGRLRGRLREAGIDPDELFAADYYADHHPDPPQAPRTV